MSSKWRVFIQEKWAESETIQTAPELVNRGRSVLSVYQDLVL